MDTKNTSMPPLRGKIIPTNGDSSAMARQIADFLENTDFSQMQESVEKLKSMRAFRGGNQVPRFKRTVFFATRAQSYRQYKNPNEISRKYP